MQVTHYTSVSCTNNDPQVTCMAAGMNTHGTQATEKYTPVLYFSTNSGTSWTSQPLGISNGFLINSSANSLT